LIPSVAEQRQDDDEPVEKLHVEAAEPGSDDAAVDERGDSTRRRIPRRPAACAPLGPADPRVRVT
jgi:hypothetical protein